MKIDGAAILVSGGASGLGEATVRRLHREGARVTVSDVDERRGEALAAELGIGFVRADVRVGSEVEVAVDAAASLPGRPPGTLPRRRRSARNAATEIRADRVTL